MSAVFTGKIQFGIVSIDCKLHTAEDRFDKITLKRLDRETHQPITMTPSSKDTIRAYDCGDKASYIQIDQVPSAEKSELINITSFVPIVDLPLAMLEKAYNVESSKTTRKSYTLLLTVLDSQQKAGMAKMVLRGKTENVAILAQESGLVAFTLRPVRLFQAETEAVTDQEIEMAEQLVEAMSGFIEDVDWSRPEHEQLKSIIQQKLEANDVITIRETTEKVRDIQEILKMAM